MKFVDCEKAKGGLRTGISSECLGLFIIDRNSLVKTYESIKTSYSYYN